MSAQPPGKPKARPGRGFGWWGRQHPKARAQRLEMLMGILGFFTAVAFIVTVVAELRGEDALQEALVLLGFAVVFGWTFLAWRRYSDYH